MKMAMKTWISLLSIGCLVIQLDKACAFSTCKHELKWRRIDTKLNVAQALQFSRSAFLVTLATGNAFLTQISTAEAFEGGIGGLGKTKPETGVQYFSELSAPVQNAAGLVTAEININNQPVLVRFQTPWPLLPTKAGIEARDLQQPESAFVQVVKDDVPKEINKVTVKKILLYSVLSQQGKFGAYAAPTDVKVKATEDPTVFSVTFTSFTPGLRESERQLLVKARQVGGALVFLITGTTSLRFKKQQPILQKVVDSFDAYAAPSSKLR